MVYRILVPQPGIEPGPSAVKVPSPSQWLGRKFSRPFGLDGKEFASNVEIWVQSLGWEDPLEKEMTIHSSILAWRIPWSEEPGGLQSMGSQGVGHN